MCATLTIVSANPAEIQEQEICGDEENEEEENEQSGKARLGTSHVLSWTRRATRTHLTSPLTSKFRSLTRLQLSGTTTHTMTHVLRVPKLDLPAVLSQQNPQIDLRLDAYDVSTRNFLAAVSNYTQRAVSEITNRKNHSASKKKATERTQAIEAETNQCKLREIELVAGAPPRLALSPHFC